MADRDDTTAEINRAAQVLIDNLLPKKSGVIYKQCYDHFAVWQREQQTTSVSEETILVYFDQISKKFKPSSMWAKYSMLKSTLQNFRNIDISKYNRLITFLKHNGKGFKPTKSKTLQPEEVEKFLAEAPDDKYLAVKVALIFGITGACRRHELRNIKVNDIQHHGNMILVKIPTKTDIARKFTIEGQFYEIVKQYEALRPKKTDSDNFFLCFRDGRVTQQVIGVNAFGAMPKTIAMYLKLKDPKRYTGHSFRRTSATMLADGGADLMTLKKHGGWKSDQVAMGYIEDSINKKKKICRQICSSIDLNRQRPTSSTAQAPPEDIIPEDIIFDDMPYVSSSAQRPTSSTAQAPPEDIIPEDIIFDDMPYVSSSAQRPTSSTAQAPPENIIPEDIIFDDMPYVSSSVQVNDKENSCNLSEALINKKIAIELNKCNVTFNFTAK